MFKKMFDLPIKAFDEMKVGEFISRIHGDASAVANIITNQLISTIVDILRVIFIGFAAFSINLQLALLVLLTFPLTFLIFFIFGKKLRIQSMEAAKLTDNYFSNLQQSISGIREIRSLGIKDKKYKDFLGLSLSLKRKNINIGILNSFAQTLSQSINFISQVGVIALGGYFIFNGSLSMDHFIAFSSYSNQFSNSLMNITRVNTSIQQALTSLERIFGLMDNLNYSTENYGNMKVDEINGKISFEDVYFGYEENIPVINSISFDINANRKIAIVGSSGGGKSTIFNLLLQFYKPLEGCIKIDGIDIKDFDEESIRKHISVVRQEPFLFNMSIRDNLLIVNPYLVDEDMIRVCKNTCIHDFIMNLPNGYDTLVGENGINLSSGQKQRIAIARALLKNSKIILFDEPTSSLDNESQYIIKEAINTISIDHTIIIIAHRLSTIIEADEIFIIDNGRLIGQGNHEYLINSNMVYKRLYEKELELRHSI